MSMDNEQTRCRGKVSGGFLCLSLVYLVNLVNLYKIRNIKLTFRYNDIKEAADVSEAKTTKAYKVSPELKEKLERLAAESGLET